MINHPIRREFDVSRRNRFSNRCATGMKVETFEGRNMGVVRE
jgi:hypothetical protein